MKTITGLVFLMGAAACAVCAAQTSVTAVTPPPAAATQVPDAEAAPRTLPSHPEPGSGTPHTIEAPKKGGAEYSGYVRVVLDGQELYCRNDVATGSHAQRKYVCLTEAQVTAQQREAQLLLQEVIRRTAETNMSVNSPRPMPTMGR